MLAAEGITVRRGGRFVLSDVSCTVSPGEIVVVIGPNGAGKTTLLHAAAGTLRPDAGTISLDGRLLADWPRAALARRRAVLPQHAPLSFPFTVLEVVLLGRSPHRGHTGKRRDLRVVEAVMAETDLLAFADRRYTELSGGERQRVQLARVLAQIWPDGHHHEPSYLLLDEPTNNLDLRHQTAVLDAARHVARRGGGVLAILHDLNLAALYADRVYVIAEGAVFAVGPPDAVIDATTMEAAFGVPVRVMVHPDHGRPMVLPV